MNLNIKWLNWNQNYPIHINTVVGYLSNRNGKPMPSFQKKWWDFHIFIKEALLNNLACVKLAQKVIVIVTFFEI